MTVANNRERGLDVEDRACVRWPLEPIAHAHEDRDGWCDLEFTDVLEGELTGPIALEGDRVEVKSCWDRHANGNGRWWIRRDNHERLVDVDGWYVLAVVDRDTEEVCRMSLTRAKTVDAIIDNSWWDCGDGGRCAREFHQIYWTTVFDDLRGPQ
ncbi:hypothetical protein [Halomontanus rarus]|uniref:hypothetical protein n=1 Tax=Halomontanus rarus TaxID=3034020 RepID=UPI0023E8855E|nr:hypothetical protein [Halovivax sp. TS33]